jgi:LmbE family N-acetylglucosaminyl deacetylase
MTVGPLVHFSPHPDDWLFFWGQQAIVSADAGRHSIFIHLTAGDAGLDDGWWQARERAVLAAMGLDAEAKPEITVIQGHPVATWRRGNRSGYFLRLADGFPGGLGSSAHRPQSLSHLRNSGVPLDAVDGSTSYRSFDDLAATLAAIVREAASGSPTLHAPEYRGDRNPGDHIDHIVTADLVRSLAGSSLHRRWYLTYCSYYLPIDSGFDYRAKASAFAAYRATLAEHLGPNPGLAVLDGEWLAWAAHEHVREVPAGEAEPQYHDAGVWLDWGGPIGDDEPVRRSAPVIETKASGDRRIRHPLTDDEATLGPVASVLWDVLSSPHTIGDLAGILGAASPETPESNCFETCRIFVRTLLNNRLAVRDRARPPMP